MTGEAIFFFVLGVIAVMAMIGLWNDGEDCPAFFALLIALALFFAAYRQSGDEHIAKKARKEAEREAQIAADQKPRLISEADGCKVYAFKAGERWHYFTRCANSQTTTDTAHTVRNGKQTSTEYTKITTEGR